MDAVDHCKDPLHILHSPSKTHHIAETPDDTQHVDDHPQLRFCSTSCVCMTIGVIIAFGSISMTACAYFADVLARETVVSGNVTDIIVDEHLRGKLKQFRTIGPALIGLGIFFMLCACVLLCEARDRLKKASEESEKILPIDYNVDERYLTASSVRAQSLMIAPDIDFPFQSSISQDSESASPDEVCKKFRAANTPSKESHGSPVVLVHGVESIDDCCSKSSQELPTRPESLKRSKQAGTTSADYNSKQTSHDSSPIRGQLVQDSPLRKLPKLQRPPPSPSKTPKLLELSPSKLPCNNTVFPKPLKAAPLKLPQRQQRGESIGVIPQKATTNTQTLQTDFPSPCSSCAPSPTRIPRNNKTTSETYPMNTFVVHSMSPDSFSSNSSSSNKLAQRTKQGDQSPMRPTYKTKNTEESIISAEQTQSDADMEISDRGKDYSKTCVDGLDNINITENQSMALCNVSPSARNQRTQNSASLPDSEQDSPPRDTNSNITTSTTSVHSRNSIHSPSRARAMNNNKREVVLV